MKTPSVKIEVSENENDEPESPVHRFMSPDGRDLESMMDEANSPLSPFKKGRSRGMSETNDRDIDADDERAVKPFTGFKL